MRYAKLVRHTPPPRPGHLSNTDLWLALMEVQKELQSDALFEAYPGRDVLELQAMAQRYLDTAENEMTIASLERAVEAS